MKGRLHKLTDVGIESHLRRARDAVAKGHGKRALLGDGGSLYLQITPTGSASWLYRYMVEGRAKAVGLGAYPTVSLRQARQAAMALRLARANGLDPQSQHREASGPTPANRTFSACAEAYIEAHRAEWRSAKHAKQWSSTLATYADPHFGQLSVDNVSTADVRKALAPIWLEKSETASRLRARIEAVIDWAIAHGYREGDNPARWKGHLEHLLARSTPKSRRTVHHASLPYQSMPDFMVKLDAQSGMARWALEFLILTAARTGEAIDAVWDEIDLEKNLWVIPAHRMKAGKQHRVPLVPRAIEVLKQVAQFRRGDYVFPGSRTDRPLSNMAMSMLLRRMNLGQYTVHGFRSTFRDFVAAETHHDFHTAEAALAHKLQDQVAAAYARSDLLEKRLPMMLDWHRFIYPNTGDIENESSDCDQERESGQRSPA